MKITVYTVSDCQFSKAEKEYLQSHNLPYEEKNLEQNRDWLTEMLTVSNNFAGTPVTKIEKDDGQILVLKGFTQEEFDEVLGFKKQEPINQEITDINQPTQSISTQPPSQTPSATQPTPLPQTPFQQTPLPNNQLTTSQPPVIQSPSLADQNQPITQSSSSYNSPSTQPINPVSDEVSNSQSTDPLASILTNLEQKANRNQPPSSPPPANIPNIPDFND